MKLFPVVFDVVKLTWSDVTNKSSPAFICISCPAAVFKDINPVLAVKVRLVASSVAAPLDPRLRPTSLIIVIAQFAE